MFQDNLSRIIHMGKRYDPSNWTFVCTRLGPVKLIRFKNVDPSGWLLTAFGFHLAKFSNPKYARDGRYSVSYGTRHWKFG